MSDEIKLYTLAFLAVWAVVWICIVAVLKARQKQEEKDRERLFSAYGLPYITDTDFWIGLSIWWPVLLALSPLFILYKLVYKMAKIKED